MLQSHSGILGRRNTAHKWHHLFSDNGADLFISTTKCAVVIYVLGKLFFVCLVGCLFFNLRFWLLHYVIKSSLHLKLARRSGKAVSGILLGSPNPFPHKLGLN